MICFAHNKCAYKKAIKIAQYEIHLPFYNNRFGCRTSTDLVIDDTLGQIHYRSNIIKPEFTVFNESTVFEITQLLLMNEGILSTAGLTAAPTAAGNQLQLVCCLECNPCAARSPTN